MNSLIFFLEISGSYSHFSFSFPFQRQNYYLFIIIIIYLLSIEKLQIIQSNGEAQTELLLLSLLENKMNYKLQITEKLVQIPER